MRGAGGKRRRLKTVGGEANQISYDAAHHQRTIILGMKKRRKGKGARENLKGGRREESLGRVKDMQKPPRKRQIKERSKSLWAGHL